MSETWYDRATGQQIEMHVEVRQIGRLPRQHVHTAVVSRQGINAIMIPFSLLH